MEHSIKKDKDIVLKVALERFTVNTGCRAVWSSVAWLCAGLYITSFYLGRGGNVIS